MHIKQNNYNCHNIYWDPLIWLVKNGHLIALTCISFSNEPGPYSWGGRGHSRQNYFCDTVQCFNEEKWTACNYWHFTLHLHIYFQVEKQRLTEVHTTPKWTVVIPIGCPLPCAVPEISSWGGGGGGGSTSIWQKINSDSVVCLFFAFFLVLGLFYRSQMVNFKEKYYFSRFRRGSKFFQGGGGGGGNCLLPIETQIICDFPGGPDHLAPPLWIRTWLRSI